MPIERLLDQTPQPPSPDALYERIKFPEPPADRPYVYINMVSTIDGKIVLGESDGPAAGVGGPTDQLLFRRLQHNADAALIGGNTLRASQVIYPPAMARFAATRSGDLPLENRFFRDAPDRAYVIAPGDMDSDTRHRLQSGAKLIEAGIGEVDWTPAMRILRQELGIRVLLCEGGGQINDQLIRAGLADELFLTLAPKLKGGARLPTILGGLGFPPGTALPVHLLSLYRDEDELYLRYRLNSTPRSFKRSRTEP